MNAIKMTPEQSKEYHKFIARTRLDYAVKQWREKPSDATWAAREAARLAYVATY